jgi:hypothetical protein
MLLGIGTGPARSHAQPPLGGEHGEHGEDPPLARSEHRGTGFRLERGGVIHSGVLSTAEKYNYFLSSIKGFATC